jgi:hypothetical protein
VEIPGAPDFDLAPCCGVFSTIPLSANSTNCSKEGMRGDCSHRRHLWSRLRISTQQRSLAISVSRKHPHLPHNLCNQTSSGTAPNSIRKKRISCQRALFSMESGHLRWFGRWRPCLPPQDIPEATNFRRTHGICPTRRASSRARLRRSRVAAHPRGRARRRRERRVYELSYDRRLAMAARRAAALFDFALPRLPLAPLRGPSRDRARRRLPHRDAPLAARKATAASRLNSRALQADAMQTKVRIFLSVSRFSGLPPAPVELGGGRSTVREGHGRGRDERGPAL